MARRAGAGSSGFTLVELMVTLAVLAILLAAAQPSFADFFERYRLRSAVDDTFAVFANARQAAVEADRNVRLSVGGTTTAWCVGAVQAAEPGTAGALVETIPAACDCTAAASCMVGGDLVVVNGTGRTGVSVAAVGEDFTYDSKGGTLAVGDWTPAPSIQFLSSTERYGLTVVVSALGQARTCVTAGKRPVPGYQSC
ncbi:prepilin-type N-terminal cleavage/methylation domain-containing protein [Lysobacter sp. D1-1-M9]